MVHDRLKLIKKRIQQINKSFPIHEKDGTNLIIIELNQNASPGVHIKLSFVRINENTTVDKQKLRFAVYGLRVFSYILMFWVHYFG